MTWDSMSKRDMEIALWKAWQSKHRQISWDEQLLLEAYNRMYSPELVFAGEKWGYVE